MENNWPETTDELVEECEKLIGRFDLYTLGEKGEPFAGEDEPRVDGAEYLAGEYQYGVAMIPAQWVTHVVEAATLENELNPDGLPAGLTISKDGTLLNWRGENYRRSATLGSEADVGDALVLLDEIREAGRITYDDYSQLHDAISVSGSGMCRIEWRDDSHDTESGYEHDGAYFCTNCGADLPYPLQECWDDYQAGNGKKPFDCCPHCGKEVSV